MKTDAVIRWEKSELFIDKKWLFANYGILVIQLNLYLACSFGDFLHITTLQRIHTQRRCYSSPTFE